MKTETDRVPAGRPGSKCGVAAGWTRTSTITAPPVPLREELGSGNDARSLVRSILAFVVRGVRFQWLRNFTSFSLPSRSTLNSCSRRICSYSPQLNSRSRVLEDAETRTLKPKDDCSRTGLAAVRSALPEPSADCSSAELSPESSVSESGSSVAEGSLGMRNPPR